MGFGTGFSSQSDTSNRFSYSDSRQAGGDNALVQQIRATGTNNRLNAATAPYSVAGTGNTVTFTDGGAFDLIGRIVGVQSGVLSHVSAAGLGALSGANNQLAALAETKVTDGANLNQKTSITALAVLALIALAFFFFRRKGP